MMNIFEKTYAQVQEANRVYKAATTEADKERARAIYHEATDAIEALGDIACRVWREYEVSRDSGNTCLDINDVVWDKDVEGLISCMRDNGIDHFNDARTAAAMFQILDEQPGRILRADDTHDILRTQEIFTRKGHDGIHEPLAIAAQDIRAI